MSLRSVLTRSSLFLLSVSACVAATACASSQRESSETPVASAASVESGPAAAGARKEFTTSSASGEVDPGELALRSYTEACERKHRDACAVVSMMYLAGRGVEQAPEQFLRYAARACLLDHGLSCARMAKVYRRIQGEGSARAAALDERACRTGYAEPCFRTDPEARCMDVATESAPGICGARVSVDAGSFDPDGGPLSFEQVPPGPYPVGRSAVTLRLRDAMGLTSFCVAEVSVFDRELPVARCNAPESIRPPDAPYAFQATVQDNCSASVSITDYDCFKQNGAGKRIDKKDSCAVSIDGDTLRIRNTGGVGSSITWTLMATDASGNVARTDCRVDVANPGKNK